MAKLFRNIREHLLHEGHIGRYVKYALGEIVLVVLGILIALQINNWNESRKARVIECKHVARLIADTQEDLEFYESRSWHLDRDSRVRQRLLDLSHHRLDQTLLDSVVPEWFHLESTLAYQSAVIMNNPEAFDFIRSDSVTAILRDVHAAYEYVDKALTKTNALKTRYGIPANIRHHWFIENGPHLYRDWSSVVEDPEFPGMLANDINADENSIVQIRKMETTLRSLLAAAREHQSGCAQ